MSDQAGRSAEACPACGAHRVAILTFPKLVHRQHGPLDEIYGVIGKPLEPEAPGIGCLACGAEWPDLESFRTARETHGDHLR